jgi:hypothetical protein
MCYFTIMNSLNAYGTEGCILQETLKFSPNVLSQITTELRTKIQKIFTVDSVKIHYTQEVKNHLVSNLNNALIKDSIQYDTAALIQQVIEDDARVYTLNKMIEMGAELNILSTSRSQVIIGDVANNVDPDKQMTVYTNDAVGMIADNVFRANPAFLNHWNRYVTDVSGKNGLSYYHAYILFSAIGAELLSPEYYAHLRATHDAFGRRTHSWLASEAPANPNAIEANLGDAKSGVISALPTSYVANQGGRGQIIINVSTDITNTGK